MHLLPIVLMGAPVVWGIVAACRDLIKARSKRLQPVQHQDNLPSATLEALEFEPNAALKSAAHAVSEGVHTAEAGVGSAIEQIGHFLHH
jgi:hypothetical protein